jgi:hypothetical protein
MTLNTSEIMLFLIAVALWIFVLFGSDLVS